MGWRSFLFFFFDPEGALPTRCYRGKPKGVLIYLPPHCDPQLSCNLPIVASNRKISLQTTFGVVSAWHANSVHGSKIQMLYQKSRLFYYFNSPLYVVFLKLLGHYRSNSSSCCLASSCFLRSDGQNGFGFAGRGLPAILRMDLYCCL